MSETTGDDATGMALRREDREQARTEAENFASHEHRHSDDTVDMTDVAQAWLADDPDPQTRDELIALLKAGDSRGLAQRFQGRLHVAPHGLVGTHGAGPAHLNRVTVAKLASALAGFLRARGHGHLLLVRDQDVLSARLIDDMAEILLGAGLQVAYLAGKVDSIAPAMASAGADTAIVVSGDADRTTLALYVGEGIGLNAAEAGELDAAMATAGPLMSMPRGDLGRLRVL